MENARLHTEIAERERLMQEDLKAASELQTVLLPGEAPEIEGLEVAIGLRPAREISGDLYEFVEHPDKRFEAPSVVIAFGDSSGKGVAAALYGAVLEGLMRTLAPRRRRPAELMKALNDALLARKVEARFVTMLLMLWHPRSREFHMANAGGNPPMICRTNEMVNLKIEGVPLGLLPDREYDEICFQARPGDTILLYSDGVSDHMSVEDEEYGSARLEGAMRGACHGTPKDLVDAVFADLDRFNEVRFDDQTVIAIKVK